MPSSFDDPLPWPPGTRPRTIILYAEDDGAPTIDLPPLVYCPKKSPTRRIEPQAVGAIHRRVEIVNQLLQLARKRIIGAVHCHEWRLQIENLTTRKKRSLNWIQAGILVKKYGKFL